ncbi:MAG: glutamate--tRNA ligase, partial [Tissierellia bacterium]|nr:glutamate--tRNA ligase [Tissierellia bacterium]
WRRNNPDKSIYDFPFTLKKMGKSGALFDLKKLEDVSKDTLSRLSDQRIYDFLLEWARAYEPEFAKLMEDDENFIKLIGIGRNRKKPRKDLAYARQIFEYMNFYFDDYYKVYDRLPENVNKEDAVKFLEEYLKTYESSSDNNEWFDKVKAISEPMGFATNMKEYKENPDKFKGSVSDLCNVIRLTMNGRLESADLCDIGKVMGDERVRDRIEKFINTIK